MKTLAAVVAVWILLASTDEPARAQIGRIEAVDSLLTSEVERGHIAGAAVQIVAGGRVLHRGAYGFAQLYTAGVRAPSATPTPESRPPSDTSTPEPRAPSGTRLVPPDTMTTEHLFDLASLTKVFATTFGVMMLVDKGLVDLEAPVNTYVPEFSGPAKDSVTVRHLMTHSSGLTEWEPTYYHAATSAGVFDFIARQPLKYAVGAERHYSDLGFMLLGLLIERVTGHRLDVFLDEHLYEPLGLTHTLFRPLDHGIAPSQIAATSHGNPFERRMVYDDDFGYECDEDPTSWDGWRTYTLRGEVNDGNAYYANGGIAGHAGLFSTLDDLQKLLDVLLDGGSSGGQRFVSPETVRKFTTRDEFGNGLGWAMDPAVIQSHGAPAGTFGHTGFTGTSVIVMPALDLTIIFLTNRQHVDASGSYSNLNPTRRQLTSIVLEYIEP